MKYLPTSRIPALLLLVGVLTALPVLGPAEPMIEDADNPENNLGYVTPPDLTREVPMIEVINDPVEGYNRAIFSFNNWFAMWVMRPVTKGYRAIAPLQVRLSIRKFGHNLAYPLRLVTTLLQGKFKGAGVETARFLVNTTVGLLGFFDPAGSKLGLRPYDEDFGQTFGEWGSGPGFYFVLPFLGPSSGRDTLAWPFDAVLNPASWAPGLGQFLMVNTLSFSLPTYLRLMQTEMDPYILTRDFAALARKREVLDYRPIETEIEPSPTLQAIFLDVRDPRFPDAGATAQVKIPSTGRELPYSYWLQPTPAPLIFIMGGVGNHRLSESAMAFAEIAYTHGLSAVTLSSAMNWEFMEHAATVSVPGYTPVDAMDVYRAIDAIHQDLQQRHGANITAIGVMGLSLGALHSLYLSAFENERRGGLVPIDRFVAVNPPIDLFYSMRKLDEYYNAPLQWPEAERAARIQNTLFKAVQLTEMDLTPKTDLPFDAIESQYLIGLNFRLILRDIIYTSQRRNNMGVLATPLDTVARQAVYDEISQFSYLEYVDRFVVPYYLSHNELAATADELVSRSNLRWIEDSLAGDEDVRVYLNEDDFIIDREDIPWLRSVLGGRLTVFEGGGHLGNLYRPEVQAELVSSLVELRDNPPRRDAAEDAAPAVDREPVLLPAVSLPAPADAAL